MSSIQRKIGPLTLDVPALLIGIQILAEGWEKLEGGHQPLLGPLLLLLGTGVFVAAFLTLWLEKRVESTHGVLHLAEGSAVALSAVVLLEGGKLRIPLLMLLAGLCYVVLGVFELQPAERRARLAGPLKKSFAAAFLGAAVLLAAYTGLHDRDPFAFGTAGLLAAIGVVLLRLRHKFVPAGAHAPAPVAPILKTDDGSERPDATAEGRTPQAASH